MTHFIPTTTTITSEELTDLLILHIISKHGIPMDITTDRGSIFTANYMKAFCEGLRIEHNKSTAYHPQTDGQSERTNQIVEQYLRCYINYQQDNWSQILATAEFSYNNTIQASIETTPFYALYGYHPRFSADIPIIHNNVPRAEERLTILRQTQEDLRFFIRNAQLNQAKYYDKKKKEMEFEIGQEVMLNRKFINTTRPSKKLDHKKFEPFKIIAKVGTQAYR
jgi:transposase InsO family protein